LICRDTTRFDLRLTITMGGICGRSYSPLVVYKLTRLADHKVSAGRER
jgi:hypothetical protein